MWLYNFMTYYERHEIAHYWSPSLNRVSHTHTQTKLPSKVCVKNKWLIYDHVRLLIGLQNIPFHALSTPWVPP